MYKATFALVILLLVIIAAPGCSGSGMNPVEPPDASGLLTMAETSGSDRVLWGIWDISFDAVNREISITSARYALAHFDITDWLLPPDCEDCLKIQVNSYDPVGGLLDVDVTLRNPTQLAGFDVRGILFTNDEGYVIENADGWTPVFDIPGGEEINPFKAYAKGMTHRIFFPNKEHTQNYLIHIPPPPEWTLVRFAVDASWPVNCNEPYAFENFHQEQLYGWVGAKAKIEIDVLDWQNDVTEVLLLAPELTGEDSIELANTIGNTWEVEVVNTAGLGVGEYVCLLHARSSNTGENLLYQYVTITITDFVYSGMTDVTPPHFNTFPEGVCIDGNYLYTAGGICGFHIYDISDPVNPEWFNWVDIEDGGKIEVDNGYAYVSGPEYIQIIDIDPLESAYIVSAIYSDTEVEGIAVSGGYAHVTRGLKFLEIYNVSQPDSPQYICSVATPAYANDVAVSGDYAYVACSSSSSGCVSVVDISSPADAYIVLTLTFSSYADDLLVSGDSLYVSGYSGQIQLVDISDPESAYKVTSFYAPRCKNLTLSGGYMYATDSTNNKMHVLRMNPDGTGHLVNSVHTPGETSDVAVSGNYAYVADEWAGLAVMDISSPESAQQINAVATNDVARDVVLLNDLAIVADNYAGLNIIDISTPGAEFSVKTVATSGYCHDLVLSDGLAYVLNNSPYKLDIIDIDPYDTAYILNSIEISNGTLDIAVSASHAYIVNKLSGFSGLDVYDIDPPESAHFVTKVETTYYPNVVAVSGNYAYVGCLNSMNIIDISEPGSAYLAAQFDTGMIGTNIDNIALADGYAYFVTGHTAWIIDISTPTSPEQVNKVWTNLNPYGLTYSDGYLYIPSASHGVGIMDVDPPEEAKQIATVYLSQQPRAVAVSGSYAYAANWVDGLAVIDLNPLSTGFIVNTIETHVYSSSLKISGDYAYSVDNWMGLRISDISSPEIPEVVNVVPEYSTGSDVWVCGDYAYIVESWGKLFIFDVSSVESPILINEIWDGSYSIGKRIAVSDGYAYMCRNNAELLIFDVDPPESAHEVKVVETLDRAKGIDIHDDYAYVAVYSEGLLIVDISSPDEAFITNQVQAPGENIAYDVGVSNGYAFVADWYAGLHVFDVSPIESASYVNTVDIPSCSFPDIMRVTLSGGYAFYSNLDDGLWVIDIDPPESAHVVDTIDTPGEARDVAVSGDYVYVSDYNGGLRIFELW